MVRSCERSEFVQQIARFALSEIRALAQTATRSELL